MAMTLATSAHLQSRKSGVRINSVKFNTAIQAIRQFAAFGAGSPILP
jgi:hypothetical protein